MEGRRPRRAPGDGVASPAAWTQTTLSAQELVVAVRAPLGTISLHLEPAAPFVGQSFAVRAQGATEAAHANLVLGAQRGPCTPPDAAEVDSIALGAGPYDESSDVTVDPEGGRALPDRVCGWLYAEGGMLLAAAEQPIGLRYDGTLGVTLTRFIAVRLKHRHGSYWAFEVRGHTTFGKVVSMRARIVKGGSCAAVMSKRKGANFDFQCLLKRRPRRPFVVEVTSPLLWGSGAPPDGWRLPCPTASGLSAGGYP